MLLILLSNISIWSKSLIQHVAITLWMLYRLQYQWFWNQCFFYCDLDCRQLRWSIVRLWAKITAQCVDYPIYKTKDCWHSVDVHFQHGVTIMSCTVLAEKATSTFYINYYHKAKLRLPRMGDQKSSRLHWCSFSGWVRERAAVVCAPKGCQCLIYRCLQPITTYIMQDAKPKIIDTSLMLIFRMGQ